MSCKHQLSPVTSQSHLHACLATSTKSKMNLFISCISLVQKVALFTQSIKHYSASCHIVKGNIDAAFSDEYNSVKYNLYIPGEGVVAK